MGTMDIRAARLGLCAMLALAQAPGVGAAEIAEVLGVAIDRSELPAAEGPVSELGGLYDRIWQAVSRHFMEQNGLAATREEIAEVLGYEREFERRDRDQRARKLKELDLRLAGGELAAAERAWLEEFRATLARLAQSDAENDQAPPPDPERRAAQRAQWIEMWKMNRALYERYGGVVALTRFGPYPHGARVALLEDYERRGLLRFSDRRLRERLFALLATRPSMTLAPGQVDFTPYWKRPIPPSYFPD
jgi:hypothetical protein